MAVTMQMVAKRAGVSRAAVSKVIHNRDTGEVAEEKREKILHALQELDYHPHAMGRGLVMNKSQTIGVVLYEINYITDPCFATMIAGMENIMGRYDYNLQFATTNDKGDEHQRNLFFIRKARERRIDGLVIMDQIVPTKYILMLKDLDIPFVLLDRRIENLKLNYILADHEGVMEETVEYLIKKGHKRLAMFISSFEFDAHQRKLKGYISALRKYNLGYDETLVRETGTLADVENNICEVMRLNQPPTVILSSSDEIAAESLRILKNKGFKIPEDVAIVGYNDTTPLTAFTDPPISSIQMPLYEMGNLAAKMIINLIEKEKLEQTEVVLRPRLIIRKTC